MVPLECCSVLKLSFMSHLKFRSTLRADLMYNVYTSIAYYVGLREYSGSSCKMLGFMLYCTQRTLDSIYVL
ncbi:hypothetical protein NXS19_003521 [Fusarium pseudograminearum]|nr:hypothetical protein NXS19_003521 [Fusarium pseudograminearum]